MITCKEDLFNTQILGDGALEYQRLAFEFGIGWNELGTDLRLRPNYIGVTCKKYGNHYELASIRELSEGEGIKTLTVNDLKIKQEKPTKFVKVEESIFDLKEEFDSGELYFRWLGNGEQGSGGVGYDQIDDINMLLVRWEEKRVYRQVEIDWRESVRGFLSRPEIDGKFSIDKHCISIDCTFNEGELIEFCHFVAELTDKPE